MPHIQIDVDFSSHPKVIQLDPLAELLFTRMIQYAGKHLTDGFIPTAAIPLLTHNMKRYFDLDKTIAPNVLTQQLVVAKLLRCRSKGWLIHDYLHWNLSKHQVAELIEKRKQAGKAGGIAKALAHATPIARQLSEQNPSKIYPTPIPIPIPTPKTNSKELKTESVCEFEQFWNLYPKKVGKREALKVWEKTKDKPPLRDIALAIDKARSSEQWQKENGRFIPNPATWLNQGRWDDQPITRKPTAIEEFLQRGNHDQRGISDRVDAPHVTTVGKVIPGR